MKDLHIYGAGNLQASRALLLPSWDIIRSNTLVAREAKETRERLRVTERTKPLAALPWPPLARSLAVGFACHSKWRAYSWVTLLTEKLISLA